MHTHLYIYIWVEKSIGQVLGLPKGAPVFAKPKEASEAVVCKGGECHRDLEDLASWTTRWGSMGFDGVQSWPPGHGKSSFFNSTVNCKFSKWTISHLIALKQSYF